MFRPDDFNSNIVARFVVNYRNTHTVLDDSSGTGFTTIFTASQYFPGSKITNLVIANRSLTNSYDIEFSLGDFVMGEYTIGPATMASMLLSTPLDIFLNNNVLNLEPGTILKARPTTAIDPADTIDILVVSNDY